MIHSRLWRWTTGLTLAAVAFAQSPRDQARQALDAFQHEKRYAVIVGINEYVPGTFPSLQFAVADADALDQTLSAPTEKFAVDKITATAATTANIKDHLHAVASTAEENSTLVFYFAGHGGEVNGHQYLASFEVTPRSLDRGLPIDEIRDELQKSKARRKILVIDACRADMQSSATRGVEVQRFSLLPDAAGLQILNATGDKESSYEDPQFGHGVFTHFIVRGLQGEAADEYGLVYFSKFAQYVHDNVREWVSNRFHNVQQPSLTGLETTGDFLLGGALKPPAVPRSAPPPQPTVEDAFHLAESAPNRGEMLRAFAFLFPRSQYTPLAEYDAAAADPNPAKAYFDLGVKFMDMGEHPMAVAALTQALHADPKNIAAAGYRALELSYDLALNDSIVEAGKVLAAEPGNIPALLGRGMALNTFGVKDRAQSDLDRVTASHPSDARGFVWRGDAWYALDKFDSAIADFTRALDLRHDYGVAYNERANAYSSNHEDRSALDDYTISLRLLPNNPVIWGNRGVVNEEAGNTDAAFQDLAEALRLRPTYALALWQRGDLFLNQKQYLEAIRDYTAALQQTGFVYAPGALSGRGKAYILTGKFREAVADYTKYIRLLPAEPSGFELRAMAREKLGDAAGAAEDRAAAERLKKH